MAYDYNFITPRLATGAAVSSAADVDELVAAGITHIIDARQEVDDAGLLSAHPDLHYLWNPTVDDGQPKGAPYWGRSIDFGLTALARPGTRLLAHCAAGVNRGPSTAYAILRAFGVGGVAAASLIRAARPQVGLAYMADVDSVLAGLGYA